MFPSACAIRSAQCAALIALATVAGISRFAARSQPEAASPNSGPTTAQTTAPSSFSSPRFSLFAQLVRLYRERFDLSSPRLGSVADDLAAPRTSLAPLAVCATPSDTPTHLAEFPAAAFAFSCPIHVVSDAMRCHRFPFAVGPPAPTAHSPQRADGTSVPGDVSARWLFVPPHVPSFLVSVARLACLEFSGRSPNADDFPPSSVLRGEPALLSAPSSFRPLLGVSERCEPRHFSFST